jgi:hypothetical protein
MLKRVVHKRKELLASKEALRNAKRSAILKRHWKGQGKITPVVKEAAVTWIGNHENVVTSPICNETILAKQPGSNKKHRVPKLLLEIPVRELHNPLVAPLDQGGLPQCRDANGNVIVSDTSLQQIIKKDVPQLRRMCVQFKQMCGCKICMSMHSMHKSLNAFCQRLVHTAVAGTLQPTEDMQTCTDTHCATKRRELA